MHLSASGSQAYFVCTHGASWHASCVCVLVLFWTHLAVSWLQLYIGAGRGLHVESHSAFVCVPAKAKAHVLVALSQE